MVTSRPNIQIISLRSQLKLALLDLQDLASFFEIDSKREIEKKAAQYTVQQVLANPRAAIHYKNSGRPYLKDPEVCISISHAGDKLAVLFSSNGKEVGVDIETVRDKVLKIKEKFLSPTELQHLLGAPANIYTLYWAIKEAVYKAADLPGLIFSEQILVAPFEFNANGGVLHADVLRHAERKSYVLHYRNIDDYILVYTDNA